MKTILAALLLATSAATAAPGELDKLRPGDIVRGFRITAVYLDDADKALGARFIHERTGHTLDYLQIGFVVNELKAAKPLPHLGEYAVAQAFLARACCRAAA